MKAARRTAGEVLDFFAREEESARGEKQVGVKEMRRLIAAGATIWEYAEMRGYFTLEVKLNGRHFATGGTATDFARLFGKPEKPRRRRRDAHHDRRRSGRYR